MRKQVTLWAKIAENWPKRAEILNLKLNKKRIQIYVSFEVLQ